MLSLMYLLGWGPVPGWKPLEEAVWRPSQSYLGIGDWAEREVEWTCAAGESQAAVRGALMRECLLRAVPPGSRKVKALLPGVHQSLDSGSPGGAIASGRAALSRGSRCWESNPPIRRGRTACITRRGLGSPHHGSTKRDKGQSWLHHVTKWLFCILCLIFPQTFSNDKSHQLLFMTLFMYEETKWRKLIC